MFNKIKSAFTKKKKANTQSFQMEDKQPIPEIQKATTLDFQMIDEVAMQKIESEYQNKQRSNSFDHQDDQQKDPFEQVEQFMEYLVKEDDSLFGIALKFSVNHDYLMRLNDLSSDLIFPGQMLKVPATNQPRFSVIRVPDQVQKQSSIWSQENAHLSEKFDVIYCTSKRNIKGQLTVTSDIVLFDPDEQEYQQQQQQQQQENNEKKQRLNACISMQDINEAVYYVLPNPNGQLDYLVQILLSGIGRPKFEKKYQKQLQKYKQEKKSIATVFFRHAERDKNGKLYTEEVKKESVVYMSRFISESCSGYQQLAQLTKLPYIDLIEDNSKKQRLVDDELKDFVGERMGKMWASLEYVPILKDESKCFTDTTYKQVLEQIPAVFRLANWLKYFTIDSDGSSFTQMLIDLRFQSPLLLIIKDFDMNVFGAYLSAEIQQYTKCFRGNGETFLFNYDQNKNEIRPYFWTEKNRDFIYCDDTGLGVGCGDKFGLFIDQSLSYGYSNTCDTFDNPRFSNNEKFHIKHLEVWGISMQ